MRFNIEDLRKGNVSKERIEEVVLRSILKIDPTRQNEQDILRNANKLIHEIEKTFLFKPVHIITEEDNKAIFILDKRIKDLAFFSKLVHANKLIMDHENTIRYIRLENRKKALIKSLARLESLRTMALIHEQNYITQRREIEAQRQLLVANELYQKQKELDALYRRKDDLKHAIAEHNNNIRAARILHTQEIMKHIDNVHVNGVYTFEGMNEEQKQAFVEGYLLLIEEEKIQQLATIEHEIKQAQDELKQMRSPSQKDKLIFHFNPKINQQNDKIENLIQQREKIKSGKDLNKLRELGDRTGNKYINSKASDQEINSHLSALNNESGFVKNIQQYSEIISSEYDHMLQNLEILNDTEKNIKELEREVAKNNGIKIEEQHEQGIHFEDIVDDISLLFDDIDIDNPADLEPSLGQRARN